MWMKWMLKDIGLTFSEPIIMHCDNKSTISISKKENLHRKTKHIAIKYHFPERKSH